MSDLLKKGSDWLESMRNQHATRMVTYVRGTLTTEVAATIGKTVFHVSKDYGGFERTEARDFLIYTEDLELGGEVTLPERGDQIREAANGTTHIYEVMAPGGEPHYRYSDSYRKTLRVHTKLIGTEDA